MKEKWGYLYEITFFFLSIISVILAIVDINNGLAPLFSAIDNGIWILFVVDYIARLTFSKKKLCFIKSNIFDLIAILPFNSALRALRALKFLKILKLAKLTKTFRMFAVLSRFAHKIGNFLNTNGFKYMLLIASIFTLIGGSLISFFENIPFSDGIWWAFVTTTTVGYGDISPGSTGGRIVACVLMIVGIGLVGALTSTITSYFLHKPEHNISNAKIEMILTLYNQLNDDEKKEFLKIIVR